MTRTAATTAPAHWFTPPQLAEQLGVDPAKVLGWIKRCELAAVNVASTTNGRPRWRISQTALDSFLAARQSAPAVHVTPKTRRPQQRPYKEFV